MDLAADDLTGTANTITDDIPPHVHAQLDKDAAELSSYSFDSRSANILSIVINASFVAFSKTEWPINPTSVAACKNLLASNQEIGALLKEAHRSARYSEIRRRGG